MVLDGLLSEGMERTKAVMRDRPSEMRLRRE